MKKSIQNTIWIISIAGIIIGWWFYTKNKRDTRVVEQVNRDTIKQERKDATHKAIIELANKHNAVINWHEPLNKTILPVFTIEIEDMLLRKDNHPVLFYASVEDIERKENKHVVHFLCFLMPLASEIEMILECSSDQVRNITQQKNESETSGSYAVIAVVDKIKKMSFEVNPLKSIHLLNGKMTMGKIIRRVR